jgi:hypothetical protein
MRPLILLLAAAPLAAAAAQDTVARPAAPPPAAAAPATALSVEAVLARAVMDRVPHDTGTSFPATVGELFLWTRVTGAAPEDAIHHLWFRGAEQVADVELRIGGSPWRTWSRKTITPEDVGEWHVEVRDAAGNVLQRVGFVIAAEPTSP